MEVAYQILSKKIFFKKTKLTFEWFSTKVYRDKETY
jgi:hypothetical protein